VLFKLKLKEPNADRFRPFDIFWIQKDRQASKNIFIDTKHKLNAGSALLQKIG